MSEHQTGRCGPAGAPTEESRRGAEHRPTETVLTALPDQSKGGELVLKLFAFTPAFATSAVDNLRRREDGQTMAEYGVVLAVMTLAVVGAMTLLSNNLQGAFESIASILSR
jgi:Flp pilus assembly pilin Flp